ncbi:MAG: FAD-dependent oxidoreductase [Desulfotomaculales bacterium]
MGKKMPGTVWIFIGSAPWILYWALAGPGLWTEAVTAGLGAALVLNAYRFRQRQVRTMELVTLAFFAAHFAVTVILDSPFFKTCSAVLAGATLALMAWGTLLAGSPFTYQYAREGWPREYWRHPLFYRTNAVITAVWGAIFTLNAVLGALALVWPGSRLWLTVAVPNAAVGAGIAFSLFFPNSYPKRILAREIAAREPYRWPDPVFGPVRPAGEAEHDVIVVGAGIGGLTAAALLARRGLKVLVAEQHHRPGGFCTSWERYVRRDGERLRYVFDAGVHDVSGLGPRGPVTNLLRRLEIGDRLEWRRVGHAYVLPGFRLKVPGTAEELVEALQARFPAEREAIAAFFTEMEGVYRDLYADVERTGGVPCPPRTPEEMLAYPHTHPYAFRWMDLPYTVMLERFFQDATLKRFLLLLTGYLSDRPEALTAAQMAPLFGYYFDGGYYPVGGSRAFADALAEVIEAHGGRLLVGAPVRRILIEKGGAIGVSLDDGQIHRAAAIVSNADPRRTFLELVGREYLPADFARRIEEMEFSTSAFAVFLGVDFVPDLEPVTLVHTEDGRGLGIMTPSRVDPGLAPPGHAGITLLTLVPRAEATTWDRRAPDYARRKRAFGDALIVLAERVLPGLREHIVFREEASPATFARYARTTGGAIYGPAAGQWRPPAKSPVERLYLAGAGVFPGAGIEAVVISGTLAADTVYPER